MEVASCFHRSEFGRFLNSSAGRVIRLLNGVVFVALGVPLIQAGAIALGVLSLAWGALAVSAGTSVEGRAKLA